LSFMDNQEGYCHDNIVYDATIDNNDYGVYVDLNYMTGCTNNLVFDSSITNSADKDVEVVALEGTQNFNLTFLNVSFDKGSIYISNDVESGELYVKWYLDVYVKDINNNPQEGAKVTIKDMFNQEEFYFTEENGTIPRQVVDEFYQNAQGRYYTNFYQIIVGKLGFYSVVKTIHVYDNEIVVATLKRIASPVKVESTI